LGRPTGRIDRRHEGARCEGDETEGQRWIDQINVSSTATHVHSSAQTIGIQPPFDQSGLSLGMPMRNPQGRHTPLTSRSSNAPCNHSGFPPSLTPVCYVLVIASGNQTKTGQQPAQNDTKQKTKQNTKQDRRAPKTRRESINSNQQQSTTKSSSRRGHHVRTSGAMKPLVPAKLVLVVSASNIAPGNPPAPWGRIEPPPPPTPPS